MFTRDLRKFKVWADAKQWLKNAGYSYNDSHTCNVNPVRGGALILKYYISIHMTTEDAIIFKLMFSEMF